MDNSDKIKNLYFEYLYSMVSNKTDDPYLSYRKLLMHLHDMEFTYTIDMDHNRYYDGMSLRTSFANEIPFEYSYYEIIKALEGPCSVLEMIVALAKRYEEEIMDDPRYGCRLRQWFWIMLKNMNLDKMTDAVYNRDYVNNAIIKMLNRDYEPDGRGGLFYIPNCEYDLRNIEIWTQLCWFSNKINN